MTLDDRVAIVTGAGQGIGKATAIALARAGAHVAAVDIDPVAARATADAAAGLGRKALAVEMIPRRSGAIVNLASIAGKGYAGTSNAIYAASKGAVIALTRIARPPARAAQHQRQLGA